MPTTNALFTGSKLGRSLLILLLVSMVITLAAACGSDSDSDSANSAPASQIDEELEGVSAILNVESTYSVDDYIAAGWKKSKQYDDISTVPEATEVYFGFFAAKDIEVRIYASHDSAKTAGIADASEDIDQSFREGGQYGASNRGAGSSAVTKFKAFAVVGNTVLLCEQSIDSCTALVDALGG